MNSDIVIDSGRSLTVDFGPVVRKDALGVIQPVDLSLDGTKLWFTVKRAPTDAAPVAQQTWERSGGANVADGITVSTMSTLTGFNGFVHVAEGVLVSDAAAIWSWDLTLQEPSGDTDTLKRGALKMRPAVTPAA